MSEIETYSVREIGGRERLEDYAADQVIETPGGYKLHLIIVSDGTGGGDAGEQAARLTVNTIIDFIEINETARSVPALLVSAVEEANRVVYEELRGTGSSTVSVAAVDLNDGEHGRAFIASVGNSRIYLMRDNQLVRLNIDHTLANEYIYAGQMSENEANRLANANYPTRMIGVNPSVQVDIGFYVEKGNPQVNSQRAFAIGKVGMQLYEGDTLFVATEGLFNPGRDSKGSPVVSVDEFKRHAMDDDVERAARAIMRYANSRSPEDNVSMSLMFVPSRFRRTVRDPLSRTTQALIYGGGTVFSIVLIAFAIFFWNDTAGTRTINATSTQFRRAILALSATPTQTSTPTATASPTPTNTPTPRPTVVDASQVGVRFLPENAEEVPLLLDRLVELSDLSYALIFGSAARGDFRDDIEPQLVIMSEDTNLRVMRVVDEPQQELADLQLEEAEIFVSTGDFQNDRTRTWLQNNDELWMDSESDCFSAERIPPDPEDIEDTEKFAFACFDLQQDGICHYEFPDGERVEFEMGTRIVVDIENDLLLSTAPADYEQVKLYFDRMASFEFFDRTACLTPYLDIDEDTVPYPLDECEFETGTVETDGCPDGDLDGLRDSLDECPTAFGPAENDGCPLSPTPTLDLDPDGDGIIGEDDQCPAEQGPASNNGCPVEDENSGIAGIIPGNRPTAEPTCDFTDAYGPGC